MRCTPGVILAVLLVAGPALAQRPTPWCFTGFHPGEVSGTVFLPEGDLFCPLIADPKAEHSFLSVLRGEFPSLQEGTELDSELTIGSIGVGDAFPLVRFARGAPGNGVQVALVGSVFAQVYHQSSHLGDEFLLRTDIQRENLSFEAVELLLSQELGPVRAYGGGQYLFNQEPEWLDRALAHAGVEIRVGELRGVRFVGAVDAKAAEQWDWDPGWSARAGIEVALWRDEAHPPRLWGILLEFYDGPSPYGQFFQEQVRWWGAGLHVSL